MTALDVIYTSNETTGIKGYEKYIQETIPNASIRLITKREIEVLVNEGNELLSGYIDIKATARGFSWLYSTTYWTQSSYTENARYVWRIDTNSKFFADLSGTSTLYGVRPVITIPIG